MFPWKDSWKTRVALVGSPAEEDECHGSSASRLLRSLSIILTLICEGTGGGRAKQIVLQSEASEPRENGNVASVPSHTGRGVRGGRAATHDPAGAHGCGVAISPPGHLQHLASVGRPNMSPRSFSIEWPARIGFGNFGISASTHGKIIPQTLHSLCIQ